MGKFLVFLLFLDPVLPTALAQEPNKDEAPWTIKVGTGVLTASRPWQDIDTETAFLPYIEASIGNWKFGVDNLISYQWELSKEWSMLAGIKYRSDGYDSNILFDKLSDNQVFNNYESPDGEVIFNYRMKYDMFSFEVSQDISDQTMSTAANLTLDLPIYKSRQGMINISTSVQWYDSNYVNYYYGIEGNQVDNSVGRFAYQTSSAINYGIKLDALYFINRSWFLVGSLGREKLDDNILNSPLIDTDKTDAFSLLIVYQFRA